MSPAASIVGTPSSSRSQALPPSVATTDSDGTSAYVTDHGPRAMICRTSASVACARCSRSLRTSTSPS